MRADIIHITNHAFNRWKERVTKKAHINDITNAVLNSKIIKKNEILPYVTCRVEGMVYSFDGKLLFVLEPITINEFKLITVIATNSDVDSDLILDESIMDSISIRSKIASKIEMPEFETFEEERTWLSEEKRKVERKLAEKNETDRIFLLDKLHKFETLIKINKPKFMREKNSCYEKIREIPKVDDKIDYGPVLSQIVSELKEIRSLIENKQPRIKVKPFVSRMNQRLKVFNESKTNDHLSIYSEPNYEAK